MVETTPRTIERHFAHICNPGLFTGFLSGHDFIGSDQLQSFEQYPNHDSIPSSLGAPSRKPRAKFYDNRKGDHGYGVDGPVNLTFAGPDLATTYVHRVRTEFLPERWSVDAGGSVQLEFPGNLILLA
jgi:hypothetical protein